MKRLLCAAASLALLSGATVAQTTVTTTEPAGDTAEIAPAQRTMIKKYVTSTARPRYD